MPLNFVHTSLTSGGAAPLKNIYFLREYIIFRSHLRKGENCRKFEGSKVGENQKGFSEIKGREKRR